MNIMPKPYEVVFSESDGHRIKSGYKYIADVYGGDNKFMTRATATLFAAAPDLYEAAQAVSDAMKSNNAYDLFPAVEKLRLAIRKAEGK